MQSYVIRRVGIAVVSAAVMAGASACGGGTGAKDGGAQDGAAKESAGKQTGGDAGSGFSPLSMLRTVQQKTGEAKSAKVETTMQVGSAVNTHSEGVLGWSDGVTGTMQVTQQGGQLAEAQKKAGNPATSEARYVRDGYYARMGDAFAQQIGGKHWIYYSYDAMAELLGPSGAMLKDQLQNSSPDQGVKGLLASGDVKKVGEENVRGVAATHYAGTVDVAKLAEKNSTLDKAQLDAYKAQLTQAGITTEQIDIWVDKDNLLVKKTEKASTKSGPLNSTAFYSDYGTPAAVEKPAASDTADFAEIMKKEKQKAGAAS
ncbi:hypothetical protein [Streptomyces sp. NPDC051561]|uniref:hypothetical protein n=1 Tax=Streptomyces sp. NPDC051561 TaxID=3365658 RepID=UPI00379106ED